VKGAYRDIRDAMHLGGAYIESKFPRISLVMCARCIVELQLSIIFLMAGSFLQLDKKRACSILY